MTWRPKTWKDYARCTRCGVATGKVCLATGSANGKRRGEPRVQPHPGRRRRDGVKMGSGRHADPTITADRLTTWKRLARRGVPRADIAHQLGMTLTALDQLVVRARRRGHPDAVYHLHGYPPNTSARVRTGPRRCPPADTGSV